MTAKPQALQAEEIATGGVSPVDFGREICGSLDAAERREWLVTNGLGGFASGTVAGLATRRFHGLLFAALKPPFGRTLLVAKLDETARYAGQEFPLATNRWLGGAIAPKGYLQIERFRLEGTTPVWTFALADALVEKRVWMHPGENTTYVRYDYLRGTVGEPLELELKALVNYRDFSRSTRANNWQMSVTPLRRSLRIVAFDGAVPFYLLSASALAEPAHIWYRDFDLAVERYRGLEDREDHLHAGTFHARLEPGDSVTIVSSTESAPELDGYAAFETRLRHEQELLSLWAAAHATVSSEAPGWVRQLVLAADQFLVARPLLDDPDARSVIAGYHWFGEWSRDTMISLPGLTLAAGRPEMARNVLRTFAGFVDRGMLPNVVPQLGEAAEYNSADAMLWYFEAVRHYYAATRDAGLLGELFPLFAETVNWYLRGTRYNVHVDPADGLLAAGEPGVQVTWMDAKVGDCVITPRIGKPVEINALWYNTLVAMAEFARALGKPAGIYDDLARRVRASFERFWNPAAAYCFDVIDGPLGADASLRPNQIFAVSLPESPLEPVEQRGVVDACARHLLTSHGLRSLAPSDPHYQGHYGGPPAQRDGAYHQGTVWAWLLGPFVLAHLRVYGYPERALSFLEPIAHQLRAHGVGTLSEIFDGDAPFTPRGCIAQAWSVAEVLRAWLACRKRKADRTKSR
ncbi:MAG TPA: amylo-alpha-1,6-glucosidase [Candidatus Acidoferrales bacterium]|nr:amylo-alpha-1,6-glucosidase [Candidatus Acidoferrales bacterium]